MQPYPTLSEKIKKIQDTHYHSQEDFNSLTTPWVIMKQLWANCSIKNKYSYNPLSPLQHAWSWWTRLGLHLHEDSRRYSVIKSLGGVSCISSSPLKEQDLCPHRNIFIRGLRMLDLELLPKNPFWMAIISTVNENNLVKLDMDTLLILRESSATLCCTSWTWRPSQIQDMIPQQGEDDQRVRTEKTQLNINRKEEDCILSPRVEQYSQSKRSCRCLTQATLTYS
jgi:hypothetical protein